MVVASNGPNTPTEFITAVSIAYAVRIWLAGTVTFQSGRIERFIGGAEKPRIPAKITSCVFDDPVEKSNINNA